MSECETQRRAIRHHHRHPGGKVWKAVIAAGLVVGLAPAGGAQSAQELAAHFQAPPIEYHTVPSWWWDGGDPLQAERLDWQMEQLKSQGVNVLCLLQLAPFVLQPPYHTEPWWSLVRHVADKAAATGMKLWISDGIAWGSPLVNNTVVEEDPAYRGQILAQVKSSLRGPARLDLEIPAGLEVVEILGAYAYPMVRGELELQDPLDLSSLLRGRKLRWSAPEGEWMVMIFDTHPGYYQSRTNFGGFLGPGRGQPLDYMNPKAMKRLLDVTLGEYERRLSEHIGTTVVATFQDELLTTHGFPPFSPRFPDAFREWKGYDLLPALAALFQEAGPLTPKIRCDYFDVWVRLLEEAFFKPQFEWYERRKMMLAHDQFGRDSLLWQVRPYADYFRTMRWYQAPGVDDWHEARSGRNLRDIKLASSIAHLYERPRVFSEALHTAGWGLTLEQQRQVVNEEYVMGVNLYDEILFNYTTHNSWFEWAPAATMFRQSYFRHKRLFNDYVHRLSYLLSQGKHVADVAILYPITSLQAGMSASGADRMSVLINAAFFQLMESLFYSGIDFDVIDEESIQRATVERGCLEVAGESYQALVLPPLTAIHHPTAARIAEFSRSGGLVVGMTRLPTDSPQRGRQDEQVQEPVREIFEGRGESSSRKVFRAQPKSSGRESPWIS